MSGQQYGRGQSGDLTRMIASGGVWVIGGRVARTLVTLIGMAFLARLLQPADFGVLALVTSMMVLSLVVLEGFVEFPILRHDALSRDGLRSLIWLSLSLTTIAVGIIWIAAPLVERAIGFPHLAIAFRVISPILFAQVVIVAGTAMLRRMHRFRTAVAINVVSQIFYFLPAVTLAFAGFGLLSALIGQIIAMGVSALAYMSAARLPILPPRKLDYSALDGTGVHGALGRMLAWGWTNIDTIMVAIVLGPAITGLYSRAYNINVQIKEPFAALDSIVRQAFAALKNREGGLDEQVERTVRLITIASAFLAAGAIAARHEIVFVLLGPRWEPVAPILAVLAVSLPAKVVMLVLDGLAGAVGNMRRLVLRHVVLLALIGGGVFFGVRFGPLAVAANVSLAIYVALLVPQGAGDDRRVPIMRLMLLMVPGLVIGAALCGVAEFLTDMIPAGAILARLAALLTVFGVAAIAIAITLPSRWLGSRMDGVRRLLFPKIIGAGS